MEQKYLNEAIIGNKNIVETFSKTGELLRVYFPNRDNRQYIDFFKTGVKVNNSDLIYLDKDVNNIYKQYFEVNTNVLNTEITNNYFNLKVLQTDFVMIKENVIVKKYTFMNLNKIDLDIGFFIHSGLQSCYNNTVGCKMIDNGMIQYAHDFVLSTFAKGYNVSQSQINGTKDNIKQAYLQDKDYIGMSKDSGIKIDIGVIKPNEKKEIEICILLDENKNISEIEKEIDRITRIDIKKELAETKSYWRKYVKKHSKLNIKDPQNEYEEKMFDIYTRSILLFPLLTNEITGGVIAAPEIDEDFTKCGRYCYCWPRDAVFITKALDILDMTKSTEKFYKVFCKKTQSKSGMWEQRFFTDGKLAPCWGYQIDETASVVYGVFEHYKVTKSETFLKDTLQMCERAVDFLKRYTRDVLGEGNKYHVSYDLWEMNEGVHFYSLCSIYSAFTAIVEIYKVLNNNLSDFENNRLKNTKVLKSKNEIEGLQKDIKEYLVNKFYNEERKSFIRNTQDKQIDISLLGAVVPFNVFSAKEKKIANTIENITLSLRTYTGGFRRFESDNYMNGNPWPIANLWLAMYYCEIGDKKNVKECLDFVVRTATNYGYLAEQIDNETLKSNWVIGLGWSHAMFIILLEKIYGVK